MSRPLELARYTTATLAEALDVARAAGRPSAILWPVGSTEPHGPHLPLCTDTLLAEENARRSALRLRAEGIFAVIAPSLPYGVTDFAEGFAGAISIPAEVLVGLLVAGADRFIGDGFDHVALVNHHLEPGQLDALEAARLRIAERHGAQAVSFAKVVSRRWGSRLGDEFKSGACHAGRYEGSLMLATAPEMVDMRTARSLPALDISLSKAIAEGTAGFMAAGMARAYTGDPGAASAMEGDLLYSVLAEMVATEAREALSMLLEASGERSVEQSTERPAEQSIDTPGVSVSTDGPPIKRPGDDVR